MVKKIGRGGVGPDCYNCRAAALPILHRGGQYSSNIITSQFNFCPTHMWRRWDQSLSETQQHWTSWKSKFINNQNIWCILPVWRNIWSDDIGSQDVHHHVELAWGAEHHDHVFMCGSPGERKRRIWRGWTWPGLSGPGCRPAGDSRDRATNRG